MANSDIDLIRCTLSGIPPVAWLFKECYTDDQRSEWWHIREFFREFFQLIHCELSSYFEKKGSTFDKMPKDRKDYLIAVSKSYNSLYDGIREKWASISAYLESEGVDVVKETPKTPGEAIAEILMQDCRELFEVCLGYSEQSSRGLYEVLKNETKLKQLENKTRLSENENKQITKLQKSQVKLRRYAGMRTTASLKSFCEAILEIEYQKDRTENPYKTYRQQVDNIKRMAKKRHHPRNQVPKVIWNRGAKSIGPQKGLHTS